MLGEVLTSRGEKLSDLKRRARMEWEPLEAIEAETEESAGQNPEGESQWIV
jgi:hypothetical protein